MKFEIFTPDGPKTIGYIKKVENKKVLVKRVSRQRHFHWLFGAWGLQAEAIPRLREMRVEAVCLETTEDGSILEAPLDAFQQKGFVREFPPYGEQIFLPEKFWTVVRPPQGKAEQLKLWA
ncbi:MAG: hypothetical protein ACPLQP_05615 [Moorellaceae bacterium]